MKKYTILLLLIIISHCAIAFDFSAVCSTGQTLYYNITSDSTVSITCPGNYPRTYQANSYGGYSADTYLLSAYCIWSHPYTYYRLVSCFPEPSGILCIPDSVTSGDSVFRVTSIGFCAFRNTGLTKVIIPNSVMEIGAYAFEDCVDLDSLIFCDNIPLLDNWSVFSGCISLHYVYLNKETIPSNMSAIRDCPINTLVFGDSVRIISAGAFEDMDSIINIQFGNGLISIGDRAF